MIWTNKVIPYILSPALTPATRRMIIETMREIENVSCVRFKERNGEAKVLNFVSLEGCWSSVGRVGFSGSQPISFGPGCAQKQIIRHEMLHALGFWHEQNRPDRDQFVEVLWENILDGTETNFQARSSQIIDTLGAQYDVRSLMHYGKYIASKNGRPTMLDINNPQGPLGNTKMTTSDIIELNALYDCKGPMGGWSRWAEYGPCDDDCNKYRQRFCTSDDATQCPGANAYGVQSQAEKCKPKECYAEIPGHWSRWSTWGDCLGECSIGIQLRARECTNPVHKYGGKICEGNSGEMRQCPRAGKPNCYRRRARVWTTWTRWTACHGRCGNGFQQRMRTCNNPKPTGRKCNGIFLQAKNCLVDDSSNESVQTFGGTTEGKEPCNFPFIFKKRSYSSCTKASSDYWWCATSDDYDKDKKWGYCFC